MARRWWKRLLIGVVTVPLFVWGCDRVQLIYWVGHTDLEVVFAIIDEASGAPVPGARVEIQQRPGGFYEDKSQKEFVLVTGGDGLASQECRGSMCFGTRSRLGFTDTFAVHLPNWRFRVIAAGYEPVEWTELNGPQYIGKARRTEPGKAELVVNVAQHRSHAEAGAADPGRP